MSRTALIAAALALLSACAGRTEAPACRGEVFSLNAAEAPR